MSDTLHLQDARRRNIRWRILCICDTSRGVPVSEQLVLSVINDVELDASPSELRKEASFLANKGYITVTKDKGRQSFEVTSEGTEVVEYDAPCPKSVGRPQKYY